MKNKWNPFLLIGMIGIFTCGSQFAAKYTQANWGNRDIWWTPITMALPLEETKNDFAIYLNGESLQRHLARGTLTVTTDTGTSSRVASSGIKVRINNWHKVRASQLHWAIYFALALGSCATLFGIGVAQWISNARRTSRNGGPTKGRPS